MQDDPYLILTLKTFVRRISMRWRYFGRQIACPSKGNAILLKLFSQEGGPHFVNRIGANEALAVQDYRKYNNLKEPTWKRLMAHAGVFPDSEKQGIAFCRTYLKAIEASDLIGIWGVRGESNLTKTFAPNAQLVELRALEPYYHRDPWTQALADKKVLVVHPFAQLIEAQYRKRENLFKDPGVLPIFAKLTALPAVQSIGGNDSFECWSDALEFQKQQIAQQDFDIALIGAGAYGLPLGAYVKSLGKHAVQMGGSLQILFGIKGKRWDQHPQISKLYNSHWVRPGISDRPEGYKKVEGGCYW